MGTTVAIKPSMAAVFALVFIFVVASVSGMVKAASGASFGSIAAMLVFGALATGIFIGLFRLARQWENEAPTGE